MTDEEYKSSIQRIERTLILRWWIFGFMFIGLVIGACVSVYNLNVISRVESSVNRADDRSVKNSAGVDAAIKQQIIYQQQIAQAMDFLSKKNPKINVPRVVVHPPTPDAEIHPLTEAELSRPQKITPTPIPSSKVVPTKHRKRKTTPTPGPFERLFKPRSTR